MTAKVVFSTPTKDVACNSFAMGDAHRLPKTGNVLVDYSLCFPNLKFETFNTMDRTKQHPNDLPVTPRIVEYTHSETPEVVFDMEIKPPMDLFQWEVYGVYRVPSLYK